MSIVVSEMFRGRRGDAYTNRERDYLVTGDGLDADLDETNAMTAAASAAPATITMVEGGTLARGNAVIARIISNSQMVVTVQYGEVGWGGIITQPVGTTEYEFNYQAPSEHIFRAIETVGIWSKTSVAENPTLFGGSIGAVKNSDGTFGREGLDTGAGNTTNVWTFTTVAVTAQYEALVESMMGAVNDSPFKTRPTGSMRLVSVSSQASAAGKSVIRFGMQYSANVTNIQVGEIVVPEKQGHDYLWTFDDLKAQNLASGGKLLLPSPKYAIVERVFPRRNFALLGF